MAGDPGSGGRSNRVQCICSHMLIKQWKRLCAAVARRGLWLHCRYSLERSPEPDHLSWTRDRHGYKARKPRFGVWSGNVYSLVMINFGSFFIVEARRSAASPQPTSEDYSIMPLTFPTKHFCEEKKGCMVVFLLCCKNQTRFPVLLF